MSKKKARLLHFLHVGLFTTQPQSFPKVIDSLMEYSALLRLSSVPVLFWNGIHDIWKTLLSGAVVSYRDNDATSIEESFDNQFCRCCLIVSSEDSHTSEIIKTHIMQLMKQLTVKRKNYVKGRIDENKVNVVDVTQNLLKISNERISFDTAGSERNINLLSKRMKATVDVHSGILSNFKDDKSSSEQRFAYSITPDGLMIRDNSQGSIRLPQVEKVPKYCTWIFLDRNQKLSDKQTIANRRRIYYDKDGEVCVVSEGGSDNEKEEKKKHFEDSEDYILRMTVNKYGLSDLVVKLLAECFSRKPDDVQARYEYLVKVGNPIDEGQGSASYPGVYFKKDLKTTLGSFNKLFCRRCLIFNCRLHGDSQKLIYPAEIQAACGSSDAEKSPCNGNENCYLRALLEKRLDADCDVSWSPFEKSILEMGLQMFGENSCLIAKFVLFGWKTCFQVFKYMKNFGTKQCGVTEGEQVQRKPNSSNRKGADDKLDPHYTPCDCPSNCGKDCSCVLNKTICEKYCGCPKSCRKRYRGCYCAKNLCQTQDCPCYASERECDPDVCKNCWISCGDGTLAAPVQRGENHGCQNKKFLLRQHKRIALGKSDVSGWGAFLMEDVGKDEFLGEYTGEIISHDEAEKRGRLYERIDLSYLFDLDKESVLDSFGMGDKLKFANHSSNNPNCYPKMMRVAGDLRVGIYSKVAMKAGDEILYNYSYEPDAAPAWALADSSTKKKRTARKRV